MENNTYDTFEYLEPSADENETNQIIVVQADGTYLSLNNVEDNVSTLNNEQTVYDVNSQQYYIDVANPSQLMSVSDQFIIPPDENYLLNETNSNADGQVLPNVDHLVENVEQQSQVVANFNTPVAINLESNCAELTITSEQYQLLEQKGWVLFENNERIYLLDNNMRLRDVTENEELIQKLRADLNDPSNVYAETMLGDFMQTGNVPEEYSNCNIPDGIVCEGEKGFVESNSQINLQRMEIQPYEEGINTLAVETNEIVEEQIPDLMPAESDFLETTINELSEKYEKSDPRINSSTIKIKTKFALKDIPSEILLGMTVNGKKLIARIAKPEPVPVVEKKKPKSVRNRRNVDDKEYPKVGATDPKIEHLIQQAIKGNIVRFSEEEAAESTDSVVQQLLRVPAFKPAVIERKLIITKIVIEDNDNIIKECEPVLLPGRVVKKDDNTWDFQYMPDLLQNFNKDEIHKRQQEGSNDINFLQIHIQEVKVDDEVARASISMHRRTILLKSKKITQEVKVTEEKPPKLRAVYACSSCAQSFETEYRLVVHQQIHRKDNNDVRLLSAEPDTYYKMIKIGTRRQYVCKMCEFKTTKLGVIQRHVKCHLGVEAIIDNSHLVEMVHKCMICSITYLHASTLSKHILTKHIKVSPNK